MDSNYEQIKNLWNDYKTLPFPEELHNEKYDNLELELSDTYVAGCISSYVGNYGKLENEKKNILKNFIADYTKIELELSGEGKEYFDKLKKMTDLILV
jgi:hypothetical protein